MNELKYKNVGNKKPKDPDYQPIPDSWENANYTKQISTYSRHFLRELNNPDNDDKGLLVGKKIYLENNMTFSDQPVIYVNSAPI